MPDVVQNVIIDFSVDYAQLDAAIGQLEKTGKLDPKVAAQFTQTKAAISSAASDTQGLIKEFKNVATTAVRMGKSVEQAFGAGVQDALDEAGVSVDEFSAALKKANAPAITLKKEMLQLKEALARMKAEGKDTGAEFEALRARAGKLKDAISDANKEITNAGSDTRRLDDVVGSISALAGGFAAVQGAAALFGDESEDLQKTLLKVQGSMALASGIQQVYNATLKEGSLAKLADSVATGAQSAATTIYTFVTTGATAATRLFRGALVATGIGAIVVLVLALVDAFNSEKKVLEDVNKLIEEQTRVQDLNNASIEAATNLEIARAKATGATESKLLSIQGKYLQQKRDGLVEDQRILALNRKGLEQLQELEAKTGASFDATKGLGKLNEQISKNAQSIKELNAQIEVAGVQFKKTLGTDALKDQLAQLEIRLLAVKKTSQAELSIRKSIVDKKAELEIAESATTATQVELIQKQVLKQKSDLQKEFNIQTLNDQLALLEKQLIAVNKNTQEEINIKKNIVDKKAKIELQNEKLTINQIKLINAQDLKEQLDLQKDFNEKLSDEEINAVINTNKAILYGIIESDAERQGLEIENIQASAQLEINAIKKSIDRQVTGAKIGASKILEINNRTFQQIRDLKNAAIRKELSDQLASNAGVRARLKANLQEIANDVKQSRENRIKAAFADEAADNAVTVQEIANNRLIVQTTKDRDAKEKELEYKKVERKKETAKQIKAINKSVSDEEIAAFSKTINTLVDIATQVGAIYSQLAQAQTDRDAAVIEGRRKDIESLKEAGAITEKEAKQRLKQLEIAEKAARIRAAEREKKAAVFQAVLAIPVAFLKGLQDGGIYLAAVYAALAAVQAALVAAKPIPRFFRGKKDRYEGPGVVGDMGSELVERGGRMFIYTKPTQTYLGATDKVYTAAQTRQILHNTDTSRMQIHAGSSDKFDYAKFGAAIPKNSISINIDKDFISESVASALSRTRYMDRRYSSK